MQAQIRSVSQAFSIMRLLAGSSFLSLSEIARALELSPSSCLNLLRTLRSQGVIERESSSKRYRLVAAWQAVDLLRGDETDWLVQAAPPLMSRLAQRSEAAVGLWKVISHDRLQLAAHAESDAGMRLQLADAQRQPLGGGAVGRAMAAAQRIDDAELAQRFALVRWKVDLAFEDYRGQVRDAERNGFAVDRGFTHRGVTTVAVGMADPRPGFCFSASIPTDSRSKAEVEDLAAQLIELRLEATGS